MADNSDIQDLDILHPERELTIGGQAVTVREYGFVEGVRLQARIAPIIDGLESIGSVDDDGHATAGLEALDTLLADHLDLVLELVAQACDCDVAWVAGLDDEDGQALMMTWWSVNARFFLRRLVTRAAYRQARNQREAGQDSPAGPPSTPVSSATATDASSSDATPSAS